jgi:hypothetical protein
LGCVASNFKPGGERATENFTRSKVSPHRWGQEPLNRCQGHQPRQSSALQMGVDVEETEGEPAPAEITAVRQWAMT